MNIEEIVSKKNLKKALSYDELSYAFNNYLDGQINDQEMTKLLKAIQKNGMILKEIFDLTDIFIKSGDILKLDMPLTVDKHSTGGVGDKTTLVISPLVACCGVNVAKMSGRGLGHTGGTIDKLESIKGFKTELTEKRFLELVKKNGLAISSSSKNLVPMDAKVYALRDVTGTAQSIPLIAVSVMSKKIASGAQNILIDLKMGKGALIKDKKSAKTLAIVMQKIGKRYHRNVKIVITDMNNPLGMTIGNALEVEEALMVLDGKLNNNFTKLCLELASNMVSMAKKISYKKAYSEVKNALDSKAAYQKFLTFVKDQKGDIKSLKKSSHKQIIISTKKGVIEEIDALKFGELSVRLGAGRIKKTDKINHSVGIVLNKQVHDKIEIGDVLCTLYLKDKNLVQEDIVSYFQIK